MVIFTEHEVGDRVLQMQKPKLCLFFLSCLHDVFRMKMVVSILRLNGLLVPGNECLSIHNYPDHESGNVDAFPDPYMRSRFIGWYARCFHRGEYPENQEDDKCENGIKPEIFI